VRVLTHAIQNSTFDLGSKHGAVLSPAFVSNSACTIQCGQPHMLNGAAATLTGEALQTRLATACGGVVGDAVPRSLPRSMQCENKCGGEANRSKRDHEMVIGSRACQGEGHAHSP